MRTASNKLREIFPDDSIFSLYTNFNISGRFSYFE
jgi:hypothetical protein